MPRATSERFTRAHQSSAKAGKPEKQAASGAGSSSNPIFNTDRFGQHILKNPQIAQECVRAFL